MTLRNVQQLWLTGFSGRVAPGGASFQASGQNKSSTGTLGATVIGAATAQSVQGQLSLVFKELSNVPFVIPFVIEADEGTQDREAAARLRRQRLAVERAAAAASAKTVRMALFGGLAALIVGGVFVGARYAKKAKARRRA